MLFVSFSVHFPDLLAATEPALDKSHFALTFLVPPLKLCLHRMLASKAAIHHAKPAFPHFVLRTLVKRHYLSAADGALNPSLYAIIFLVSCNLRERVLLAASQAAWDESVNAACLHVLL